MEINELLSIGIVGVAMSIAFEAVQRKYGTGDSLSSKLAVAVLSLVIGTAYWFVRGTEYWPTIIGVLTSASTFYSFFISKTNK